MPRRKIKSPPVKIVRYFDHIESPLVKITPNERGEFVSVFTAPRGHANRFVTLGYQRTPHGPTSINSKLDVASGEWASVATTGPRRTFYYPGDRAGYRYEEILPTGRLLVIDETKGVKIRETWTEAFDWDLLQPKGKPLGARAASNRQRERIPITVATYQQQWRNGKLESERLITVRILEDQDTVKFVEVVTEGESVSLVTSIGA